MAQQLLFGSPQRPTDVQVSSKYGANSLQDKSEVLLLRRRITAPVIPGSLSSPTRPTFPFKPAAVTPRSVFRPVVPALTPQSKSRKKYNLPQRCITFPFDESAVQTRTIEAPSWFNDFTENINRCSRSASFSKDSNDDGNPNYFPVPITNDVSQDDCWWLDEIANLEPTSEDKKERMHVVLEKIESVVTDTGKVEIDDEIRTVSNTTSIEDLTRKTKVGITGGTLVAAGLILIPTPVIPGILVVYGGLLVLASEFDSAKNVVESLKGPIQELLRDEEDPNKGVHDCFYATLWEEMIGYSPDFKELDEGFMTIMRLKPWNDDQNGEADAEIERARRDMKNEMKRYARQMLLLEHSADTQKKQDQNMW